MSTRAEFARELRARFRAPPHYTDAMLLSTWDACMADGSIEDFDETPYSASRIFYTHLADIVKELPK